MERTDRHRHLVDLLTQGPCSVGSLADALEVSDSTVRRDLRELEDTGRVLRSYGGARLAGGIETPRDHRDVQRSAAKRAIARRTAALLSDARHVCLGAGSTAAHLAELLALRGDVHVITNGLATLTALVHAGHTRVTVLGGELRDVSQACVGPITDAALDRVGFDVAVVGADGLDPDRGVSCPTSDLAHLKERKLERAEQAIIIADHTKLHARPHPWWCPLPTAWTLVTDAGADESTLAPFWTDPRCTVVIAGDDATPVDDTTPEDPDADRAAGDGTTLRKHRLVTVS